MSTTDRHRGLVTLVVALVAAVLLVASVRACYPTEGERRAAKIEECAREVRNAAILSGSDVDAEGVCEKTMVATGELPKRAE